MNRYDEVADLNDISVCGDFDLELSLPRNRRLPSEYLLRRAVKTRSFPHVFY